MMLVCPWNSYCSVFNVVLIMICKWFAIFLRIALICYFRYLFHLGKIYLHKVDNRIELMK